MDDELQLFLEDANEQLQLMENALLDASEGTSDEETIGAIFRAMHTIKGTAGMFSFDAIVHFTHIAENLLDKVRNKEVVFDATLAAIFMQVKDYTQSLVNICSKGDMPPENTLQEGESLKNTLHELGDTKESAEKAPLQENDKSSDCWHIKVQFCSDFLRSGMDVISIFRFFAKQGKILSSTALLERLPLLDEIDPTSSYLGFEILYQTDCTQEDIEEIFEFVEDDIELEIIKASDDEDKKVSEKIDNPPEEKKMPPKKQDDTQGQASQAKSSLRVDSQKVDNLINKMSEMVIKNAQLANYAMTNEDEALEEMTNEMSALLEDVRDDIMNIRLVQVKDSFFKYRRIVNDTAKKLEKKIDFIIEGEDTELDKSVIEKLSDPLTHMIRNAIDHGVEPPKERIKKGKPEVGTVWLRAFPDAGSIIIELEDNGAGIDKEALEQKAIKNGLIMGDHNLSDEEIYKLIFEPGLSTAKAVSDLSGRGVGMDVVRRNIEDLRGSIRVESKLGLGTKITVQLPLTLAIIDGFLVQAGKTKYIIPLEVIDQCIEYTAELKGDSADTISVRGEVLPLLRIREFFSDPLSKEELEDEQLRENVVIVKYGNTHVGLLVEELFGEQQTVIKSLGTIFKQVTGISGGSIMGNGEVALIFDIPKLIEYRISQGIRL